MNDSTHPSIPRRRFLTTAGLAGAALAHPAITRAQAGGGSKLRVGIVGCGGRSRIVGDVAIEDGRYEIVALADYFQEQVDEKGERFKVPANRRYTGLNCFKRLIDAGGVDIVAVLSPPYFHPAQVEAAVEAGLHVWLAKPIAVDAAGVKRIEAAAKRAAEKKRCFIVDFQTRALGQYQEAARLTAEGALGQVGYAEIEGTSTAFGLKVPHGGPETRLRNWLQWKTLCGEALIEFSIHAIDMASLLIGRNPVSATGFCERNFLDVMPDPRPGNVKDVFVATYDFGDGFKTVCRAKRFNTHGTDEGISTEVFGSEGKAFASYSGEVKISGKTNFSGDRFMKKKIRGIYKLGIQNNWDTLHKNIAEGDFSQATVKPSVDSHLLAILGREACYRQGETVTWDEVAANTTPWEYDTEGLKA